VTLCLCVRDYARMFSSDCLSSKSVTVPITNGADANIMPSRTSCNNLTTTALQSPSERRYISELRSWNAVPN
jgi:hypothetical protein